LQEKNDGAEDDDDPLPSTAFDSAVGQPLDREASKCRRRSAQTDSDESPDLAPDGASGSAPETGHKQLGRKGSKPSDLPYVHPGQMTVFDLLGDGDGLSI
jgi:hypothetical protein